MTMPRTMKAAILVEQKKPLIVDQVHLPDALELGQVLVIQFIDGYTFKKNLPLICLF
jgi:hypothetical protein